MRNASDGGSTSSLWHDTRVPSFDSAPAHETDVCIVGAGIAGLSTALELARRGTRVVVLDDGPIGGGETGRTSAHLTSALDDRFTELERHFGERGARLAAHTHMLAIDKIEANVRELGIDCAFRRVPGFLFAPRDGDLRQLELELIAARRAGLEVDWVDRAPFELGVALRFANQAEFHPLRYLRGLAEAVIEAGGHIHTGVHVEDIEPAEPLVVRMTGGRRLHCRIAVDATNGAFTSPLKLPLRQAAYRSYVLGFDIEPGLPHMLLWDTEDPYHYVRIAQGRGEREVLIVGGGDHRVGQGDPERAWEELAAWTRARFRFAGAVVERWSGQILEPNAGLAYIGPSPEREHVYVVSGDSGEGLTHGTIAALLLPELMHGQRPDWAELYDPKRHLHAYGELVTEVAHSTTPYLDWLRPGDVRSFDDIERGSGALVRHGLHVLAAYRDDAGELHACSATCPHLRGVVQWNAAEHTWDCPCHGSRFDPLGRVLNGPAATDLAVIEPVPATELEEREPREPAVIPLEPSLRRT